MKLLSRHTMITIVTAEAKRYMLEQMQHKLEIE